MIARIWRVWTTPDLADGLAVHLGRTGMRDARATPGNEGALLLRAEAEGDEVEFTLITFWCTSEAVDAFAGPDRDRAVTYPGDEAYFRRCEETVRHLRVVDGTTPERP